MKRIHRLMLLVAVVATGIGMTSEVQAEPGYLRPLRRAQMTNWHGSYAYTPYGRPTALVVPPTANLQTNWNWGVGSSRICRIDHQFTRDDLGPGSSGGALATPVWPQDTTQFGVYYVRGPWYPTQP
jgi:hypothetical protein